METLGNGGLQREHSCQPQFSVAYGLGQRKGLCRLTLEPSAQRDLDLAQKTTEIYTPVRGHCTQKDRGLLQGMVSQEDDNMWVTAAERGLTVGRMAG